MKNLFFSISVWWHPFLGFLSYAPERQLLSQKLIGWESDESIIRILTNAYNLHGGITTVSWRPNGSVGVAYDLKYIFGTQFLFDVDHNFVFYIDEEITLEVLVDISIWISLTVY